MQYLDEYKLFILRTLLFDLQKDGYSISDFAYNTTHKTNLGIIFKYLNELKKDGFISFNKFEIHPEYLNIKHFGHDIKESSFFGLGNADLAKKVENSEYLTQGEIDSMHLGWGNRFSKDILHKLTLFPDVNAKQRKKISDYLKIYLDDFYNDELADIQVPGLIERTTFNFAKNWNTLGLYLKNHIKEFTPKNILVSAEAIANSNLFFSDSETSKFINNFKYVETLLFFENKEIIKINKFDKSGIATVDLIKNFEAAPQGISGKKNTSELKQSPLKIPAGKTFQWHCSICGHKLLETDDSKKLNELLKTYSQKNPLCCKYKSHKNWIITEDNQIQFTGNTEISDSKVFRKPKRLDS